MKRTVLLIMITVLSCFLLCSASSINAQDACEGNFDCDQDVDGTDAAVFKEDFGRSPFQAPCPACNPCPYGMVDCGTKCVDSMTDEDFCGVDSACLEGVVCGTTGRCILGVCEDVGGGSSYPAPVEKSGQTTSYSTGDDGNLEKGVIWPNPRFTDNSDGTVTDNLTGLIWLKDANCFLARTWNNALSDCNGLADGSCGLTDSSSAGDWRLPNYKELFSLIDANNYSPALPSGNPFSNVMPNSGYHTSTTVLTQTNYAWLLYMDFGDVTFDNKIKVSYVWPVRDPL